MITTTGDISLESMERSQGYRRFRVRRVKRTKKTRYAKSEGPHDYAFCKMLQGYYEPRGQLHVNVQKGHGGSQVDLVKEAIRETEELSEDTGKFLVMDKDRDENEMNEAEDLATQNDFGILRETPCLEGMLIRVLEPKKRINGWTSKQLKDYFEENYIPRDKRTRPEAYKRLFSKEKLDEARLRVKELDDLIKLFEL